MHEPLTRGGASALERRKPLEHVEQHTERARQAITGQPTLGTQFEPAAGLLARDAVTPRATLERNQPWVNERKRQLRRMRRTASALGGAGSDGKSHQSSAPTTGSGKTLGAQYRCIFAVTRV